MLIFEVIYRVAQYINLQTALIRSVHYCARMRHFINPPTMGVYHKDYGTAHGGAAFLIRHSTFREAYTTCSPSFSMRDAEAEAV